MRSIYITTDNQHRLQELLSAAKVSSQSRDNEVIHDLEGELTRARVVEPHAVPPDVVTMHSQARILDDIDSGQLSVLAPLGTAILGYRVGDTFRWKVPSGVKHLKVMEVLYQPEAHNEGDRVCVPSRDEHRS